MTSNQLKENRLIGVGSHESGPRLESAERIDPMADRVRDASIADLTDSFSSLDQGMYSMQSKLGVSPDEVEANYSTLTASMETQQKAIEMAGEQFDETRAVKKHIGPLIGRAIKILPKKVRNHLPTKLAEFTDVPAKDVPVKISEEKLDQEVPVAESQGPKVKMKGGVNFERMQVKGKISVDNVSLEAKVSAAGEVDVVGTVVLPIAEGRKLTSKTAMSEEGFEKASFAYDEENLSAQLTVDKDKQVELVASYGMEFDNGGVLDVNISASGEEQVATVGYKMPIDI